MRIFTLAAAGLLALAGTVAAQGITYLDRFGSFGSAAGQFITPTSVAVNGAGQVYVSDANNKRIQRFDAAGSFQTTFAATDTTNFSPTSVTIGAGGQVVVTEAGQYSRVVRFDADGGQQSAFGANGYFSLPSGAAVNAAGQTYVVDSSLRLGQRFAADGTFQLAFGSNDAGGPGALPNPQGVAVNAAGQVFASTLGSQQVKRYAADGTFQLAFAPRGEDPGQVSRAAGLTVSPGGAVYVADASARRVVRFAADGTFQLQFGTSGRDPGQFLSPSGVAVAGTGIVYVTDASQFVVQRYFAPSEWTQPATNSFAAVSIGEGLTLSAGKNLSVAGTTTIEPTGSLTLVAAGPEGPPGGTFTTGALDIQAGGTVTVPTGRTLTAPTLSNAGTVSLTGGTAVVSSSTTNAGTIGGQGALQVPAADPANGSYGLTNTGSLMFNGGTSTVSGSVDNTTGQISSVGGGVLTFQGAVRHNSPSPVTVNTGSRVVFAGSQSGAGNFAGTGTVEYRDLHRPGNSPAQVIYGGDVVYTSTATLAVEIGGATPGAGHDQLVIAGAVDLGGAALAVSRINGFTPADGQVFTILDVAGVNPVGGTFAGLAEGAVFSSGGDTWRISYQGGTGNDVTLTFNPVPEPAAVLAAASFGLAALRRRRA